MMRKSLIIIVFALFYGINTFSQIDTVIDRSRGMFAEHNFGEGSVLLSNYLYANPPLDSLSLAKVQFELAMFYRNYVGDMERSMNFLQQVTTNNLKADNELLMQAHKHIAQQKSIVEKYAEADKVFSELKIQSSRQSSSEEIAGFNVQLENLVEQNPGYYKNAEVYYVLGSNYHKLEKYAKAKKHFRMAIEEKPAISYMVPVDTNLQSSIKSYKLVYAKQFSSIFFGIFLLITIVFYYKAKPWRWLSWEFAKTLLFLIVLWSIIYFIIFFLAGKSIGAFHSENNSFSKEITYLFTFPGYPGSKPAWALYLYGIYGLTGIFVFSAGISVLKNSRVKNIAIPVVALLLFYSFTKVFYVKHVHDKVGTLSFNETLWQKSFLYGIKEIEPYVLTNPKAYHNLDVEGVTTEVLQEWIIEYCPFDEKPVLNTHD